MSIPESEGEGRQPTEEELRAAYEQEIKRIRVEHVLLEHAVTMINLGMRRTGLAPGTESERDPAQVRVAIEAIRALLPLIEVTAPEQVTPLRDALSQLQLAFVQIGGQAEAGAPTTPPGGAGGPGGPGGPPGPESAPGEPGPADTGPGSGAPQGPPSGGQPGKPEGGEGGAGPAQRSGRLWVPGQ